MRYIFSSIFIVLIFANLFAANDAYIISQNRFLKIMPLYQGWKIENNFAISEVSIPLFLYFPLNRKLSLSLLGGQANVTGDVTRMNGITDTQLAFNYQLYDNLIFNIGANFPSGKKELTAIEFQTSSWLSMNQFNFQVPNFGQGFNISPGLTYARPLGDKFVLGLGASYQYKGIFKPLKGMVDDYDPGDEFLFTGGFDLRMSEKTTFATDIVCIFFGTDKIHDQKVYRSGNKILVNLRFHSWFNHNEFAVLAHYRSKSKNSYVIGGIFQEEIDATAPDQIEIIGSYRMQLSPGSNVAILAELRSFQATSVTDAFTILGLGIAPEVKISKNLTLPIRVKYLFGNSQNDLQVSGLELGLGFDLKF